MIALTVLLFAINTSHAAPHCAFGLLPIENNWGELKCTVYAGTGQVPLNSTFCVRATGNGKKKMHDVQYRCSTTGVRQVQLLWASDAYDDPSRCAFRYSGRYVVDDMAYANQFKVSLTDQECQQWAEFRETDLLHQFDIATAATDVGDRANKAVDHWEKLHKEFEALQAEGKRKHDVTIALELTETSIDLVMDLLGLATIPAGGQAVNKGYQWVKCGLKSALSDQSKLKEAGTCMIQHTIGKRYLYGSLLNTGWNLFDNTKNLNSASDNYDRELQRLARSSDVILKQLKQLSLDSENGNLAKNAQTSINQLRNEMDALCNR